MTGRRTQLLVCALGAAMFIGGCSKPAEAPKTEPAKPAAETKATPPPYRVQFVTSKGPFTVEVHPDWAPLAAERFKELVNAGYYNGNRFYRVVPGFVVQFGLNGNPTVTKQWKKKTMKDEEARRANVRGTMTFATTGEPESRWGQVFINLRTNQNLDDQKEFAPFAEVVEGMSVIDKLNGKYGEQPTAHQDKIEAQGNAYLNATYPGLDYIKTAKVL